MTLSTLQERDLKIPGSCWTLQSSVNGYAAPSGDGLATQAACGRSFEVIEPPAAAEAEPGEGGSERLRVRLLEDGYPCWLALSDLLEQVSPCGSWQPLLLSPAEIEQRLPEVLSCLDHAARQTNTYLWGGTLGPDFDCSGLVQWAFASCGIWLPRDAYQQERFCRSLPIAANKTTALREGDLVFFGTPDRCTHVGLHREQGRYWHSSGHEHGRNGIGCDGLDPADTHPVASHYRAELRGAGRVVRCHDGTTLP